MSCMQENRNLYQDDLVYLSMIFVKLIFILYLGFISCELLGIYLNCVRKKIKLFSKNTTFLCSIIFIPPSIEFLKYLIFNVKIN